MWLLWTDSAGDTFADRPDRGLLRITTARSGCYTSWFAGYAGDMSVLTELRRQAATCTACELYTNATQTVFGVGREGASIMLAGEQPGDQEDRLGEPFVGPAGKLLDEALRRAGVSREDTYVTNVVKHFRFTRQGKRRIHQTPGAEHVRACLPWLRAELHAVGPKLLVTLGATAAKSLLGSSFRLTHHRGELLEFDGLPLVATVHPSAVLRAPEERRDEMFAGLVADLELAGRTAVSLQGVDRRLP